MKGEIRAFIGEIKVFHKTTYFGMTTGIVYKLMRLNTYAFVIGLWMQHEAVYPVIQKQKIAQPESFLPQKS